MSARTWMCRSRRRMRRSGAVPVGCAGPPVVCPAGTGRVEPVGTCGPVTCGVARGGPGVWLRVVRGPDSGLVLVHQCAFLCECAGLGAAAHPGLRSGREPLRGVCCDGGSRAVVWLEAHERWDYHHTTRTQRLTRLVCLCTRCHQATPFGYAEVTGRAAHALAQLCAVNHWTRADAEAHVAAAASLWRLRSATDWALDLSILTGVGITPQSPRTPAQRRTQAATDLALVPTPDNCDRSQRACPQHTARPRGPRSARGNARAKPRHGASPPNTLG